MTSLSVRTRKWILALAMAAAVVAVAGPRLLHPGLPQDSRENEVTDRASSLESAVFSGIRSLTSLCCGEYTGAAYVRRTAPLRLFGLRVSNASVWLHAQGTARASIDLAHLSRDDIRLLSGTNRDTVTVANLPPPRISGCEIDLASSIRGRTPFLPWGGNSRAVAEAQDLLLAEAGDTISAQAVQSGLLGRAEGNACATLTSLIRRLLGNPEIQVDIHFGRESS